MIRKSEECKVEYREHMRGGEGTVRVTNFITDPGEMYGKGRLYAKISLDPGCSIGFHLHENDSEIFYFTTGTAEYNDNGVIREVHAGDVALCPEGTGHAVANRSNELVELIAVIVYA